MFKFKKVASLLASTLMVGSTIGLAAATTYPAPFVMGGTADVALVYGSHTAATVDLVGVMKVQDSLNSYLSGGSGSSSGTVTGGDYVLIAKSSDNLNIRDTWGVFTGSVDSDDLTSILADGTYVADDNDEFDFEQKITLGSPDLHHFRDSDYESAAGLSERTPVVGFKMPSNTWVLNYTMDFLTDAESDIVSNDYDDFEGSDLTLFGKSFFVSNWDENSSATKSGDLTLLDSGTSGNVVEGETVTVSIGGKSYEVSIKSLSTTKTKLVINGEDTSLLAIGESYKLSDGTYVGIKDLFQRDVAGEVGDVDFSLGTGKLLLSHGAEIKQNDVAVSGVKAYMYMQTSSATKIDKIEVSWVTDEEEFLAPDLELAMPGFGGVKFTMNELVRPEEEMVTVEKGGDNDMEITVPIKDGDVTFSFLANNATDDGNFTFIGKDIDEQLATVRGGNALTYKEKNGGNDWHSWFVASYNISTEAESYVLRAKVRNDTAQGRAEVDIEKLVGGSWTSVCTDKAATNTCDIGLVSLTFTEINHSSGGDELVYITPGANVNFNTIYTKGGMRIYLPWDSDNGDGGGAVTSRGAINITSMSTDVAGHSTNTYWLTMIEEDKDDNIASGTTTNFTIDATSSTNFPLQVSQIDGAGTGGPTGLEKGDGTSVYEAYLNGSDVAARILHYTKPDEDYAELYYPAGDNGDSETYAEVFLTEIDATIVGGSSGSSGGGSTTVGVAITDNEVSSASGKNLVVVGGSCVNKVAADLIGSSTPLCGGDWSAVTNVGSGEFLIETFDQGDGTVATLVAGYSAGDTQNAATFLTTQAAVDTTAGSKYVGTTATSAEMVTSESGSSGDDDDTGDDDDDE
jgi:hypothetical protein